MSEFYTIQDCNIAEFRSLISRTLDPNTLEFTSLVEKNIPIYDAQGLEPVLTDPERRLALMSEWCRCLDDLSGALVLKGAIADSAAVDAATAIYERIIEEEKAAGTGGDHFAQTGANDRIWNALQKLCLSDPIAFSRYFASPSISAVCEAWLGPGYQMTAQVNLVRPGGKAQVVHRDYHLGFMSTEQASKFPARVHRLSPRLTLQGAIAHCDMPLDSGPTKLLPFSQAYGPGYLAVHLPEFRDIFESNHVQLPLAKGDAIFFSPAMFHAAGDNVSPGIQRLANLLQVSSAMGRATEAVDRDSMVCKLFPALQSLDLPPLPRAAVIAAAAEGYAFPTNLDTDPPVGGLASESQAVLLARALDERMGTKEFDAALAAQSARRRA
jgi:ectoine hydroxylase-related dioxygenase (phytanoyl-CoA dioxygenase family)